MAKRPTATTTVSMPSRSSGTPRVKRACPVCRSMPTRPSARPKNRLASPRGSEAPRTAVTVVSARTMSAKYSAGPNSRASLTSIGATKVSARVAMVPAMKEPMAAVASAWAPRPCRAISWPSIAVTIEPRLARRVEQDRGGRAAIHGPVIDAAEHDEGGGGVELAGDRQEQRHGERRPDARQDADRGADRDAQGRPEEVHRASAPREAVAECS